MDNPARRCAEIPWCSSYPPCFLRGRPVRVASAPASQLIIARPGKSVLALSTAAMVSANQGNCRPAICAPLQGAASNCPFWIGEEKRYAKPAGREIHRRPQLATQKIVRIDPRHIHGQQRAVHEGRLMGRVRDRKAHDRWLHARCKPGKLGSSRQTLLDQHAVAACQANKVLGELLRVERPIAPDTHGAWPEHINRQHAAPVRTVSWLDDQGSRRCPRWRRDIRRAPLLDLRDEAWERRDPRAAILSAAPCLSPRAICSAVSPSCGRLTMIARLGNGWRRR